MNLSVIANQLDAAIRGGVYNGYGPRLIPHPLDEPVEELLAGRSDTPARPRPDPRQPRRRTGVRPDGLRGADGGAGGAGASRWRRWSRPCSGWGWQSPTTTERSSWSCRFRGARPSCSATTPARHSSVSPRNSRKPGATTCHVHPAGAGRSDAVGDGLQRRRGPRWVPLPPELVAESPNPALYPPAGR